MMTEHVFAVKQVPAEPLDAAEPETERRTIRRRTQVRADAG